MTFHPGQLVTCDRASSTSDSGTVLCTYVDAHRIYVTVHFGNGVIEDLPVQDVRPLP
jgi:hypothetical protein